MIVGAIAATLILYNGVIDRAGDTREFVGLDIGWYLARCSARSMIVGRRRDQPDHPRRRHAQAARHVLVASKLSAGGREMAERDTSVIAHDLRDTSAPDRNLALELVRVTEAAALAAARWVGRGEKESADQAAVDAMRFTLHAVPMDGIVVIGEGEKDEAPMLYNGEQIGDGSPPEVDVAVDPLEGTRLTALGQPNALVGRRARRAGHDVRPGPVRLHGEDRGRPRHRRRAGPRPAAGRDAEAGRQAPRART